MVALQGCMIQPGHRVLPEPPAPDAWHQELPPGFTVTPGDHTDWWTRFNDPLLKELVESASSGNLELMEAAARIAESRALRGVTAAALFPGVDGTGSYTRSKQSEHGANAIPGATFGATDNYAAGFDASWELDLFGKNRHALQGARADEQAAIESYRDALVALQAEVSRNYVDVRLAQRQLDIARANIKAQEQSLQISRERWTRVWPSVSPFPQRPANPP